MLRKRASYDFGCCSHCARGRRHVSPGRRERRLGRAREDRLWKRDQD